MAPLVMPILTNASGDIQFGLCHSCHADPSGQETISEFLLWAGQMQARQPLFNGFVLSQSTQNL